MKPRLLIADLYYGHALNDIFASLEPSALNYSETIDAVVNFGFGTSGALREAMTCFGWDVHVSVVNSTSLQGKWTEENHPSLNRIGLSRIRDMRGASRVPLPGASWQDILVKQVYSLQPDLLLMLDPTWLRPRHRRMIRDSGSLIIAQSAVSLGKSPMQGYDAFLSSLPKNVEIASRSGIPSYYIPHAFWPRGDERLLPRDRDIPVLFYGSVSDRHGGTLSLLQELSWRNIPVTAYCDWPRDLSVPGNVTVHRPIWGSALRAVIARSKIVVNRHMNHAHPYSNNMRMFEATGLGALLVTESSVNIDELFTPGVECCTYETFSEAASIISELMDNDDVREDIANAGRRRTLSAHQYQHRARDLDTIFRNLIDMRTEGRA